jgi:hypothetical protein
MTDETERKYNDAMNALSGQVTSLSKSLSKMNQSVGSVADFEKQNVNNRKSAQAAFDAQARDILSSINKNVMQPIDNAAKAVAGTLTLFSQTADDAAKSLASIPLIGAALGSFVGTIGGLNTSFRALSEVGDSFSGGLLDMAAKVAKSGLTMDEYVRVMQKGSLSAAAMRNNGKSLTDFAKDVRVTSRDFGNFGYSIDGLNDLSLEYAERMRKMGLASQMTTSSVVNLAAQTTALSKTFGVSREEITKSTTNAMQNVQFLATVASMGKERGGKFADVAQSRMAMLSAIPGGSELAGLYASSTGRGAVYDHGIGTSLGNLGMGGVLAQSDQMARSDKNAPENESIEARAKRQTTEIMNSNNAMVKMYAERADQLADLAAKGDADATKIISMFSQMSRIEEKQRDSLEKSQVANAQTMAAWDSLDKGFTVAVTGFSDWWNSWTAKFRLSFVKALAPFAGTFGTIISSFEHFADKLLDDDVLDQIVKFFATLLDSMTGGGGLDRFSKFIKDMFSDENAKDLSDKIKAWFAEDKAAGLGTWIMDMFKHVFPDGWTSAWNDFTSILSEVNKIGKAIIDWGPTLLEFFVAFKALQIGGSLLSMAGVITGGAAALNPVTAAITALAGVFTLAQNPNLVGKIDEAFPILGWLDNLAGVSYENQHRLARGDKVGADGQFVSAPPLGSSSLTSRSATSTLPPVVSPSSTVAKIDSSDWTKANSDLSGNLTSLLSTPVTQGTDPNTNLLLKQIETLKNVVGVQTEVMARMLNELIVTNKDMNDALHGIQRKPT